MLVGASAILVGRIKMGTEVFTKQRRAPRRKGRECLLARSRPILQMLSLQLREGTEGQASSVDFLTALPLPPPLGRVDAGARPLL